jgi:hypothetical protein
METIKPVLKPTQYYIKVTKKKDTAFNGRHPNGIFEGYTKEGVADRLPEVGQSFILHGNDGRSFWTSTVTAVRENEFDTLNSTYTYHILEDGKHQPHNQ